MIGTPELHLALLTGEIPAIDYLHVCEYLQEQGYATLKKRKSKKKEDSGAALDPFLKLNPKGHEYIKELKHQIEVKKANK